VSVVLERIFVGDRTFEGSVSNVLQVKYKQDDLVGFILDWRHQHAAQEFAAIFLVVENFHLFLLNSLKCLLDLSDCIGRCQWSMEEIAGTTFLHDLCPGILAELTKTVIAKDDGLVLYLCICNNEVTILTIEFPDDSVNEGIRWGDMAPSDGHGSPSASTRAHRTTAANSASSPRTI